MAAIGGSVPDEDRRVASPVNANSHNNTGNSDAVYGRTSGDVPGEMMARLSLGNNANDGNDRLRNNGSMNNENDNMIGPSDSLEVQLPNPRDTDHQDGAGRRSQQQHRSGPRRTQRSTTLSSRL